MTHPTAEPPLPPPLPLSAARYLRPQDLRRLQNFQLAARLVVEGFFSGRHRSPYYDASAEFADYRPYVPGDEIRALDWRAYARTDRDYIKLFRKETDMRCHILLDTSRSMAFRGGPDYLVSRGIRPVKRSENGITRLLHRLFPNPDPERRPEADLLSKFEYGAYLAAALCYLIIHQGDKAGLALGGADLQTFLPPGGTITHLYGLLQMLERTQPDGPTHLDSALRTLFVAAQRRGLLIVISDLLEDPETLFSVLSMYTHRGWQVLLLHVLTDAEMELPGTGVTLRYRDTEGPGMADADPDALRPAYQAEIQAWLDTLQTEARARRIQYARMTTTMPYDRALERYLTTRMQ
ncbi:MAG TPA: DUF58 domain-containing protein [Chthonomonadaceae bacterium]|nr:DUF58 domain-containing protein [Chthonomonadaceae bacterium]